MSKQADRPEVHYAEKVLSGEVLACEWVGLACQRHLDDLKRKDIVFDANLADAALTFFGLLRHHKGEWAGKPLVLELWQQFIVGSLFGWVDPETKLRRFKMAYIEVPRKNGKTQMAAGIGLKLLAADGEPGAEVYSAATGRDQAKECWEEARRMVDSSVDLSHAIRSLSHSLTIPGTACKFVTLSSESRTIHGKGPHGAVVDELHAHPNREVWDTITSGRGARRQPLIVAITTAGYDKKSICYEQRDYSERVLRGTTESGDSHFAYIATLDEGDDFRDEAMWGKANPNLDVSVKRSFLREEVEKAIDSPAQEGTVKRLHFDVWTQQETRLIPDHLWSACERDLDDEALEGRRCVAGLDLGSTSDTTALELFFLPTEDDPIPKSLWWFWVPKNNVEKRVKADRVEYDVWVRQGFLTATPGNVTDYDFVRADIHDLADRFEIEAFGYDPWQAQQLCNQLVGDGLPMVEVRQTMANLSYPTNELLRLLKAKAIELERNPVARWQAGNVASREDPEGNLKPDKQRSREKIDGISAMVTAMSLVPKASVEEEGSVYDEHEALTVDL